MRAEFDFFEQLYEVYISVHGALYFGAEGRKNYAAAVAMLSQRAKHQIDELLEYYASNNLAKNPNVKQAYAALLKLISTLPKIKAIYYARTLRQKEQTAESKVAEALHLGELVSAVKKARRAKSAARQVEEETKERPAAGQRVKSVDAQERKERKEVYYSSLYDLIQEGQKLGGGAWREWSHTSRIKPTASEELLLGNVKFSLAQDRELAGDYLAMAQKEQQTGVGHRLGVGEFRGRALEYIIRDSAGKLKLGGKSRLIDLQVGLKSIPAKSAINDVAGVFLPAPEFSQRIKKKKAPGGITGFLKSKLWGGS